jgi:hypothetical protein
MSRLSLDLSIFNKFDFKGPPVGVKFMFHKPDGIERLNKNMAFCVMVKEAQEGRAPFYADLENNACVPAAYVWDTTFLKQSKADILALRFKLSRKHMPVEESTKLYQGWKKVLLTTSLSIH